MKIILPCAGSGQRFVDAGYKEPKPLISVGGKKIIDYISDIFDLKDEFVFICNDFHLKNSQMKSHFLSIRPNAKIIPMPPHKNGPVFTVKQAFDFIGDDEEVIICYCDNPLTWDQSSFLDFVHKNKLDGCVLTHTGFHPHTLANTKMAFVKPVEGNNCLFSEIKEKECYTDNPMREHASTGIYYFRTGAIVKKFFNLALEKKIQYNGEFYVTLVFNLLINDGLKVGYYDTEFALVFGTPQEVQNFEAWKTIINGGQVKTEKDTLNCFNYWKDYHAKNN